MRMDIQLPSREVVEVELKYEKLENIACSASHKLMKMVTVSSVHQDNTRKNEDT